MPIVRDGCTRELWFKRNAVIADALVKLRFSPGRTVRAWELASEELGEPIRELSRVQRYIERAAADRAQRAAQA